MGVAITLMAMAEPADAQQPRRQQQPPAAQQPPTPQHPPAPPEPTEIVHFQPATPEEVTAALADARRMAATAAAQVGTSFTEVETTHFLIFTDWDVRDHPFLKTNLEDAYKTVSRQFNLPASSNIFIGKLPVYMFEKENDYQRFLLEMIDVELEGTLGIFVTMQRGQGFMAMWKPEVTRGQAALDNARRQWARTLLHEFTHAFISRYKSNVMVPRWLNEGIAEVIADAQFPDPSRRTHARLVAMRGDDITLLFDDENIPDGFFYPVMMTLVEVLVKEDRKAFIKMFDLIKAGTEPEKALELAYGVDYDGLVKGWRTFARQLK